MKRNNFPCLASQFQQLNSHLAASIIARIPLMRRKLYFTCNVLVNIFSCARGQKVLAVDVCHHSTAHVKRTHAVSVN